MGATAVRQTEQILTHVETTIVGIEMMQRARHRFTARRELGRTRTGNAHRLRHYPQTRPVYRRRCHSAPLHRANAPSRSQWSHQRRRRRRVRRISTVLGNPFDVPEIGLAFLQKSVATLFSFISHIGQTRRFTGKYLLADHAVVGEVEGEFEHLDRSRRFAQNFLRPFVAASSSSAWG